MKKQNYNKGFTLIELLVVIAIIGLLSAVVLSNLAVARSKGQTAKDVAAVKQFQTALELYKNDNNAYPDSGLPANQINMTTLSTFYLTGDIPSTSDPATGLYLKPSLIGTGTYKNYGCGNNGVNLPSNGSSYLMWWQSLNPINFPQLYITGVAQANTYCVYIY